ncbi:isochorismatase [Klebsiella oxytoca]|nr:isochorismatase [Klebsiella oxytoca]
MMIVLAKEGWQEKMAAKRVVMVVDMQNGVFATPRVERERCAAQINRLINAADTVIFIQHCEAGGLEEGERRFCFAPRADPTRRLPVRD